MSENVIMPIGPPTYLKLETPLKSNIQNTGLKIFCRGSAFNSITQNFKDYGFTSDVSPKATFPYL